eukprot:jgi/Mesvir1/10301/Mv23052-RA.1
MRFSRMRNALLNRIDQWWRRQKAFNMVDGDLTDYGGDAAKFYGGLMTADALLSGHPAPCPPGSGAVFYEWNPAEGARGGKMPKVVDPYIRDWSGQMVQNPNAQFQMCSDQMGGGRMDPYTLSGGPMAPPPPPGGPMSCRRPIRRRRGAKGGGIISPANVHVAREMDEQPGGRGAAFVTELDARRRRADAWWAAVSGRRAARGTFPFSISFNRAYMESCPLFKGKQALTEEEAAVARAGDVPPGSSLVRWSSRAPPPQEGWVSCVLCDGLMPARKTELTLLTRGAYAFYHADCFASSLRSRDESRLPPPPEPEDGDEEGATPVSSVSVGRSRPATPPDVWDLDRPDGADY